MAYIETYALNPEKKADQKIIECLNDGRNKSEVTRKALFLYFTYEELLDVASLARKLEAIVGLMDTIGRIEARLERIEQKLSGVEVSSAENEAGDAGFLLDMMDQMEEF